MVEPAPIPSLDRDPLVAAPAPSEPPPRDRPEPPVPETITSTSSQPEPESDPRPEPTPEARQAQTLTEMVALVDDAWRQFLRAAGAFPSERMDERLNEEGWTRKQMLAHISAWHDLTHDRLGKLILTGKSTDLTENPDAINARVARQAIGRTAGEILKEMEMTFNRLRRQLGRLTDEQLAASDGWAARVIEANTYEHYEEHRADVHQPPLQDGRSGRR